MENILIASRRYRLKSRAISSFIASIILFVLSIFAFVKGQFAIGLIILVILVIAFLNARYSWKRSKNL